MKLIKCPFVEAVFPYEIVFFFSNQSNLSSIYKFRLVFKRRAISYKMDVIGNSSKFLKTVCSTDKVMLAVFKANLHRWLFSTTSTFDNQQTWVAFTQHYITQSKSKLIFLISHSKLTTAYPPTHTYIWHLDIWFSKCWILASAKPKCVCISHVVNWTRL